MEFFSDEIVEINKRSSHAVLDITTRKDKARKIMALLRPHIKVEGKSILEVGIGSGGIIHEI